MQDLISRQAAIDALDVGAEFLRRVLDDADIVGAEREKFKWELGLIESCISAMKELPSAQPERKKGKWIKGINENGVTTSLFCSECNYENKHWYEWNYCPNCGARMEESDE